MTLSTVVYIIEPTTVREVFDEAHRLIGGQDAEYDHDERSKIWGCGVYRNLSGQGLPALLYVRYGVDAPLTDDCADEDHEDGDCGYPFPAWSIEVDFDTAYGYRAPNGAGCGSLHAWLVRELGRHLTERGLTWYWRNEFDGSIHRGTDNLALLGDPDDGALIESAAAWVADL